MQFTVTALGGNAVAQCGKVLLAEHGLSFYIESVKRLLKCGAGFAGFLMVRLQF